MEFVDLSRYMSVGNAKVPLFSELRKMRPLWMTQDVQIVQEPQNISYAASLAKEGFTVVPIRKRPPFDRYVKRDTFPRRILFEMTSRCNLLCRMCPQQNLKRPKVDMPGGLYRRVMDEIDEHGVEGLWLYHLGESLLHPEFRKNIEHVSMKKNLGVIWLSTNGHYLDESVIKFIFKSNIDYLNFSMHAVTEETYNKVSPKGGFNIAHANLEKFYELKGTKDLPRKPYLHCQMIEQEVTQHEVDAFIQNHYKRAEIVSINMLEFINLSNNVFGLDQRQRRPLTSCLRVARNDCFIFSNGDVTLCDAAYNGEIYLGNINRQSLYDIWNGENRKRILKLNEEGRMSELEVCTRCTDYDI